MLLLRKSQEVYHFATISPKTATTHSRAKFATHAARTGGNCDALQLEGHPSRSPR